MAKFRNSQSKDESMINELYTLAFPEEDLKPLVKSLLLRAHDETRTSSFFSFVGEEEEKIVAHIVISQCSIKFDGVNDENKPCAALLGPLCVTPSLQRKGIGTALVAHAFSSLPPPITHVFVLGDPKYYSRFSFKPQKAIKAPFELPKEYEGAWQVKNVNVDEEEAAATGTLVVPDEWMIQELWQS